MHVVYDGIGVVPPAAEADVARRLATEGAAGAPIRCVRGVEPDRAYWLVVVTDVELAGVVAVPDDEVEPLGAPVVEVGGAASGAVVSPPSVLHPASTSSVVSRVTERSRAGRVMRPSQPQGRRCPVR